MFTVYIVTPHDWERVWNIPLQQLPNQERIKTLGEKGSYSYLGISEEDTIKQLEIKEKMKEQKSLRRAIKLFETKRNLIKGINTSSDCLLRILRPFLKWTRGLQQVDQSARKLMTMSKSLQSTWIHYVSKKEGGKKLVYIEDSMYISIQELKDNIKNSKERLHRTEFSRSYLNQFKRYLNSSF